MKLESGMKIIIISLLIFSLKAFSIEIESDKSVMGVPWNSTESKVIEILGQPNGHYKATKYTKYIFYGKSVVLVFKKDRLKSIQYSDVCCSFLYNAQVTVNEPDGSKGLVLDGVEMVGKDFVQLSKELPYKLGQPGYHKNFETEFGSVKIQFTKLTENGKQSFKFNSLEVKYEM